MSRIYIPVTIFALLVIEGTLFQLMTPQSAEFIVVPRFLIVMMVFIGIHIGRHSGIVYGMVFGLIYDIVYTQILGVYMFGLAFVGYFFAFYHKRIQDSLLIQLLILSVALTFFDSYQYGLFRLIGVTNMAMGDFLYIRLFPSFVLNIAFAILVYYPVKKLFSYVKKQINLRE